MCLNRWHRSAFWKHQIDARTPGVPSNSEQRQSLALANNAQIGSSLATFRGTLSGLVIHFPQIFWGGGFLSNHKKPVQHTSRYNCINIIFIHREEIKLFCLRKCIKRIPTDNIITPIFNSKQVYSLHYNHPITSHYGQFAAMPDLSMAVKLFAITHSCLSVALAGTHHTVSKNLLLSTNIYPAPSSAQCAIADPWLHDVSVLNPLPHPLTLPPMKPLFPAMAISRSTSSSGSFSRFDFLSIKGAWISSLLFICSSVLSIYH